jgi:hypothetical protein
MTIEIIQEGVLNDNTLYIAGENKIFKGGYEAIFEYWTFQSSWGNRKHIRSFRTLENAYKFINKNCNH